jgi:hypothetical protein
LELNSTKNAKKPWLHLGELASAELDGASAVNKLLKERTGSSASRITNDLAKEVAEADSEKLLLACQNDAELRDRIKPYYHFLRGDSWGDPLLYPQNAFMIASGADRRETGTHYTPKSLTEAIVLETLEPIVYIGPSEGKERSDWQLKSPSELLNLKICDPAMGSGAFLVQVCRYLSERIGEAWVLAEEAGKRITSEGQVVDELSNQDPLPKDAEERQVIARRLVADHCLYGVDVNPLAVELAKLAIWLITLSKGRPFGFLDHNLKAGNSLLGIHDLDQLYYLNMQPEGMAAGGGAGKQLFAQGIEKAVKEALALREEIRNRPLRDIQDVEVMADLNEKAQALLAMPELIADALIGEALVAADKPANLKSALTQLSVIAGEVLTTTVSAKALKLNTAKLLATDVDNSKPRKPFHWPLAFPEVFCSLTGGFDAILGNVPFLGGSRLTGTMGKVFRDYLVAFLAMGKRGNADLAAYFFLEAYKILRTEGHFGLLATNSISEGDTRQIGLETMLSEQSAQIYAAYPNEVWPGKAAVVTSRIHIRRGKWDGAIRLNHNLVSHISAFLSDREEWSLKSLSANSNQAFSGSKIYGNGFILTENEAIELITQNPDNKKVIYPYLNGRDLSTHPEQKPSRWVINFFDWPQERAKCYEEPYRIVMEKVKPERQFVKENGKFKVTTVNVREAWWQYERIRKEAYNSIGWGENFSRNIQSSDSVNNSFAQVLAVSNVTKHLAFVLVPNNITFANTVNLFALPEFSYFALLQSSIHAVFVWKHASKLGTTLRYTPSDVYEPFPKPDIGDLLRLEELGLLYHQLRSDIMLTEQIGLTELYNRFHDPENTLSYIIQMRDLHKKIDEAVVSTYGWDLLDLEHDFHVVDYLQGSDQLRFTISKTAHNEVLDRLTLLNKQRFAEEQKKAGLAKLKPSKNKTNSEKDINSVADPSPQIEFFDQEK